MCTTSENRTIAASQLQRIIGDNLVTEYFFDVGCSIPRSISPTKLVYPIAVFEGCHIDPFSPKKKPWSMTRKISKGQTAPLPEFSAIMYTGYQTKDSCEKKFPPALYSSTSRDKCIDYFMANTSVIHECSLDDYTVMTFSGLGCEDDNLKTTIIVPISNCEEDADNDDYTKGRDSAFTTLRCYPAPKGPINTSQDSEVVAAVAIACLVSLVCVAFAFVRMYRGAAKV